LPGIDNEAENFYMGIMHRSFFALNLGLFLYNLSIGSLWALINIFGMATTYWAWKVSDAMRKGYCKIFFGRRVYSKEDVMAFNIRMTRKIKEKFTRTSRRQKYDRRYA
jgi:hypothetical protein